MGTATCYSLRSVQYREVERRVNLFFFAQAGVRRADPFVVNRGLGVVSRLVLSLSYLNL